MPRERWLRSLNARPLYRRGRDVSLLTKSWRRSAYRKASFQDQVFVVPAIRVVRGANGSAKTHWEKVYASKAPETVSWYRPHLETSLALIERAAAGYAGSIIDVGGGESTLVDDLLARGYENITLLDVSQTAIDG